MNRAIKRYFSVMVFLAISACTTTTEREFNNFSNEWNGYYKSILDEKGNSKVSNYVFYNKLLEIAKRHQQYGFEKVFRMLTIEAIKKEGGLPNQFDALETRLNNADTTLFGFAESYELNTNAESNCTQFGYKQNTPDFNKCVYDYKVTYLNLMMQQQQLMLQAMPRPVPLIVPTQTQTNCNPTYGGGFSCTTR